MDTWSTSKFVIYFKTKATMTTIIIKLMEFLKRILSPNSPISNMVIHIISYVFLGVITYLFIRFTNIYDILQIFIFSIIYFAICMFISDNFKLSNYKFIKFIQILVFIFTILGFIALILYLLDISIVDTVFCNNDDEIVKSDKVSDKVPAKKNEEIVKDIMLVTTNAVDSKEYYSFKYSKNMVDNVIEKGGNLIGTSLKNIAPNLGVGFVVGKIGFIGVLASSKTLMYKLISNTTNPQSSNLDTIVLKAKKIESNSQTILESNLDSSSNVLIELEKQNPNWKNKIIINSPLENTEILRIDQAIELLNTNLSLHFIILYLLFMVLIIFTSKLLIEKNIKLDNIKNLPLGYYIHFIFNKIINIWNINANV